MGLQLCDRVVEDISPLENTLGIHPSSFTSWSVFILEGIFSVGEFDRYSLQ